MADTTWRDQRITYRYCCRGVLHQAGWQQDEIIFEEMIMEQLYRLQLDDYSAPSFVSWGKSYYATLADIRGFIRSLAADEKHKDSLSIQELIAAFHTYEAGDRNVTHHVAYQEVPLLEPVKLLGRKTASWQEYFWTHFNTWCYPYNMRCDGVDAEVLWLETPEGFCRAVKARFRNLQYEGTSGQWVPLSDGFWGFPGMLAIEEGVVFNRLAVEEKSCDLRETAEEDRLSFQENKEIDFTGFCQEIFGNG